MYISKKKKLGGLYTLHTSTTFVISQLLLNYSNVPIIDSLVNVLFDFPTVRLSQSIDNWNSPC